MNNESYLVNNHITQLKFCIGHIKRGLPLVLTLSNILNDKNQREKLFDQLWSDKPEHFVKYLKDKLGPAISHHTGMIAGSIYISYKNIPEEDRLKIINHINQSLNVDIKSIKITLWFLKWCYCKLGIFWMSEILGLTGPVLEAEWNIYSRDNFDAYFAQLDDQSLQKFIDDINQMRHKHPDPNEMVDMNSLKWI